MLKLFLQINKNFKQLTNKSAKIFQKLGELVMNTWKKENKISVNLLLTEKSFTFYKSRLR